MDDPITFLASFPAIQSAIKVGDLGMRLQFDVPESEMAQAVRLIGLRDRVLRVTVEPEPDNKLSKDDLNGTTW